MQVWNVLHAARWNAGCKKSPSPHHRTTLSGYIFARKAGIDNRKKNLLSINLNLRWGVPLRSTISSTCRHNMANLGPLAAEVGSGVWCTPANFHGFRLLAALLHGTAVVGVSQTAALNRGRHLAVFGRAAITLGIGPHSSLSLTYCV